MDISVIIPTFARPDKVASCITGLIGQTLEANRFEVLVGIDGGRNNPGDAHATARALHTLWPGERAGLLTVTPCDKLGQAGVRNALLEQARGETIVFLNDDMRPTPGLLAAHLHAQHKALARGTPALVIGAAPWARHLPDNLFARLIRETSMVFFYSRMDAALEAGEVEPLHDWGFRHAWLLNLSAPAKLVREAGGFTVFPSTYGYEDDEFAYRCKERFGTPVLYCPEAVAQHDHPMSPDDYLRREWQLGQSAWGFAKTAPACAQAMFGRDVTSDEELAYSRAFVERERAIADRVRETLCSMAETPVDVVADCDSPAGCVILEALYQQHLLLKRWEWRRGLLEAHCETEPNAPARNLVPA